MLGKGGFRSLLLSTAIAIIAALLMMAGPLAAQTAGEITGRVVDTQGQPIPGAAIKLLQAGKAASTQEQVSDAEGSFGFKNLDSGVYIVTAAKEGLASVTCPGLRIVGLSRKLQVTLQPADSGQPSTCRPAE